MGNNVNSKLLNSTCILMCIIHVYKIVICLASLYLKKKKKATMWIFPQKTLWKANASIKVRFYILSSERDDMPPAPFHLVGLTSFLKCSLAKTSWRVTCSITILSLLLHHTVVNGKTKRPVIIRVLLYHSADYFDN